MYISVNNSQSQVYITSDKATQFYIGRRMTSGTHAVLDEPTGYVLNEEEHTVVRVTQQGDKTSLTWEAALRETQTYLDFDQMCIADRIAFFKDDCALSLGDGEWFLLVDTKPVEWLGGVFWKRRSMRQMYLYLAGEVRLVTRSSGISIDYSQEAGNVVALLLPPTSIPLWIAVEKAAGQVLCYRLEPDQDKHWHIHEEHDSEALRRLAGVQVDWVSGTLQSFTSLVAVVTEAWLPCEMQTTVPSGTTYQIEGQPFRLLELVNGQGAVIINRALTGKTLISRQPLKVWPECPCQHIGSLYVVTLPGDGYIRL